VKPANGAAPQARRMLTTMLTNCWKGERLDALDDLPTSCQHRRAELSTFSTDLSTSCQHHGRVSVGAPYSERQHDAATGEQRQLRREKCDGHSPQSQKKDQHQEQAAELKKRFHVA